MATYDTPGLTYDSGARYDEAVMTPVNQRKHMAKVKLGLFRLNVEQKITLGNNIKTAMTDNANFPSPNPPLADYGALITTMSAKNAVVVALQSQVKAAMVERDDAELAFVAGTNQLAAHVDNIAKGNAAIIESAGMGVKATAAPIGQLPQVQNLVLSIGDNPGEVDGQWNAVRGRSNYEIQQCTGDPTLETNWVLVKSASPSRVTLSDLTSGTRIWVRVRAKAPKDVNDGPWSDPATLIVP